MKKSTTSPFLGLFSVFRKSQGKGSIPDKGNLPLWCTKRHKTKPIHTLVLLFLASLLLNIDVSAQSGVAFRDFNGDGVQTGNEVGVEGIVVNLYGDAVFPAQDQLIGTTVTAADGSYNFSMSVVSGRAALAGEKLRIEFEIPDVFQCTVDDAVDFTGTNGAVYGTAVQFIEGQQAAVNYALNYPGQWASSSDPDVFLPVYTSGDPLLGGSAAAEPGFVMFSFSDQGIPSSHSNTTNAPEHHVLATNAEVGSLYGVAYSRQASKLFTSAVIRRHSGLGPLGSGGIYLIDPYTGAADKTTDFLNLDAIGIATHNSAGSYPANPGNNTSPVSDYVGTNAQRGLPAGRHDPSTDYAAGDQVGKLSLGDIDISDDGRYLYFVNLYDRKVYEIDLVDPFNPVAPTAADVATRVRSWDIMDPATNANQGEHRPWGLKYYRGKLYVGLVLSGQNLAGDVVSPVSGSGHGQIGDELRGYVFEMDLTTGSFNAIINFDFDYGRERSWIPWGYMDGQPSRYFSGGSAQREVAEPLISDIEFDDEGNLLIGIMDRKGHQYGNYHNDYNGNLSTSEYATAGELLRANFTDVGGTCQYTIVTRPGTTDYYQDNLLHPESVQGPLAVLPGLGEALSVWLDPNAIRSGGVMRLNNTTGAQVSGYEVFDDRHSSGTTDAVPSKANGLGDVELMGVAAPIEIGNLVWADVDHDGIQDGFEPGIAGVDIQLLDATTMAVIATTTTNGAGEYYFNASNTIDPDGNGVLGPLTNRDYKIRIAPTHFNAGVGAGPLSKMTLTLTDQVGLGFANSSDNDASVVAGEAVIMLTTGSSGQNNHTYDFGMLVNDYGDLPDSYATTDGSGGPLHELNPELYIGYCVDAEMDGQPEAMAGLMNNGDDNTAGFASLPGGAPCVNDEDGISFVTSLLPGTQACIEASIVNNTGAMAKLQAWIDFDGNGSFEATDELNTVDFAAGGAMIPAGGVSDVEFCFDVPATATFSTASTELYARFRLSPNGGLNAGGVNADGTTPIGEVEDYKQALAMLGDYAWIDANYDGAQDAGETPVEGVTATLHDCSTGTPTTVLASMQTDAAGAYKFIGLIDGDYCVCFDVSTANHPRAADMEFTIADDSGDEATDSDANETTGCTTGVGLVAGDDYPDLDVGIFIPAKIGNLVWEDSNANGVQDPGEPGIANAEVTLTGTDGTGAPVTLGPVLTDANGMYMFGDLKPGDYKVTFAVPAGSTYEFTAMGDPANNGNSDTDSDANPAMNGMTPTYTVTAGEELTDVDAGMYVPAKLGDLVWEDTNANGVQDAGEPPVAGINATLSGTDGLGTTVGPLTLTTGADGMYMFGGLVPGDYKITFGLPASSTYEFTANEDPSSNGDGMDTDDSDANPAMNGMTPMYTLMSGDTIPDVDAGVYIPAKLGDLVWEDTNANGVQDAGEPAIEGATATLSGTDGLGTVVGPTTLTTGADGMYMFGGLVPGEYKVTFATPAGSTYEFTANEDPATQGAGDDSDDSDADATMNGMTPIYTLTSGDTIPVIDAGMYVPAKLGDLVWEDVNGNGVQDAGEPAIEGATATLSGTDGLGTVVGPTTLTTGADGMYMFGGLVPGEYKVTFATPAGSTYEFTANEDPATNGAGDDSDDSDANAAMGGMTPMYTLTSGDTIPVIDAGMYVPAKLGDLVWEDVNGNGVQDAGEPAIEGATATLSGTNGVGVAVGPTTLTTAADGMYMFGDLWPGEYKVTFTTPAGSTFEFTANEDPATNGAGDDSDDSDANAAMGGMTPTYTLVSADTIPVIDAGMYVPAKIGDIVWEDWNHNGQQDAGEPVIEGVTATLSGTNGLGEAVGPTPLVTDVDGMYMFGDLWPGEYKITFTTPADYHTSKYREAGVDEAENSDADPAMAGMTPLYTLVSRDTNLTVDAAYYLTDFGDLPDSYGTTEASNGPKHLIIPALMMGSCVDAELDGNPDAMAGLMTGGDDNVVGVEIRGDATCIEDENGVNFTHPMIPGYQTCIEINVINTTGATAVLQAWVDWDGSDAMEADEELATGDFAGGGYTVADGGVIDTEVCFDVPADAEFKQGNAFMRFRLSPNGGLDVTGINADGSIPHGEVEDYKLPLAKVGNIVWEDRNYNGIQEWTPAGTDVGLNDIEVQLMWTNPAGGMQTYTTTSANVGGKDGIYNFCGLIPGDYKLTVVTDRFATLLNVGDDFLDSDDENGELFTITDVTALPTGENGLNDMPGMGNVANPANSFPDNQDNISFDFGYAGFDYGDLPQTFVTLNEDPAMPGMEGAKHLATPEWRLGSCIDVDIDGQPHQYAGFYADGVTGDDNAAGEASFPAGVTCDDDENGVTLITSLIPGNMACIEVTTTAPAAGFFQGWIDYDNDQTFGAGEAMEFMRIDGTTVTADANAPIAAGTDVVTQLCWEVPATVTWDALETYMRFRFSDRGDLEPKNGYADGSYPFGEVEDYYQPLASLGDYVWLDVYGNGLQENNELPLENATVTLHNCADDVAMMPALDTYLTDANGNYDFRGLIPGVEYCVCVDPTTATNYELASEIEEFTFPNAAIDSDDSDVTTDSNGCTSSIVLGDREHNPTFDAGACIVEKDWACIADINVTLNDNGQAEIVADMVLSGLLGCYTNEDFEITILDGNTANDHIVDGCGEFTYEVVLFDSVGAISGFTYDLAPANWTLVGSDISDPFAEANIGFSSTKMLMQSNGSSANASVTIPADGTISFDYMANTADANDDYIISINGASIQTASFTGGAGNVAALAVNAGDVLRVEIVDNGTATATANNLMITNFEFLYAEPIVSREMICWGSLLAEDKTDPVVVECAADTDAATVTENVSYFGGALEATDNQIALADYSCFQEVPAPAAGLHYYDTYEFTISTTDVYTFVGELIAPDFNANIALYQGAFNANNPCENIIGQSEALTAPAAGALLAPGLRMSLPLHAGTYTLMVSSRAPANATGDYRIYTYADNGNAISGLPFETTNTPLQLELPLICDDVNEVLLSGPATYVAHADGSIANGTMSDELATILGYTGQPLITDNVGDILITVTDVLSEAGDCGAWTITRTFSAEDRYNSDCIGEPRTTSCVQTITVRKPTIEDVFFPPLTAVIECDQDYPTDGATGGADDNPHPSLTGTPFMMTTFGYVDLAQTQCNLGASYSDEPRIVVCDGTYRFRREWNFVDLCNTGDSQTYDQWILVGDFTAPSITAPTALEFSTSPFDCNAHFTVPAVDVVDENTCSGVASITATVEAAGLYDIAIGEEVSLPVGEFTMTYCAQDGCGNQTCVDVNITVEDNIEPTAVCNDELNVSIGGGDIANGIEGIARVYATDIGEGSSDNCGEVTIEVRRNHWFQETCNANENRWSDWGEYVDFLCCDIDNEITVELRVTDESGNRNVCWMVVTPEDKLRPYCYAPENVELTCSELPLEFPGDIAEAYETDLAGTSAMMNQLFGAASGTDNCAVDNVVERPANVSINDCGWGTIQRRFEVWQNREDENGDGVYDRNESWVSNNSCTQVITITEVHDYRIDFPNDIEANCAEPCSETVIVEAPGCDILAVNVGEPVHFASATGDECYKVSITYDVINWCIWDGEYEGYTIPRMTEDDGESLAVDRAVEIRERPVLIGSTGHVMLDRTHAADSRECGVTGDSSLPNTSSDDVAALNLGRWNYTQFIKVYDSSAPVISVDTYGGATEACPTLEEGQFGDPYGVCEAAVSMSFSVDDECELFNGDGELVISLASAELALFVVDTNADGEITANEFATAAATNVAANVTDNNDGTYVFNTTAPIITNAMGDVLHAVRVLLEDGCGNQTSQIMTFDVIDCKGPAPICINGLTLTLMPQPEGGCAAAIWASDFDASPIYDCTGQGPDVNNGQLLVTKRAIYRADEVADPTTFVPSTDNTGVVFTEADADQLIDVYVYAFDEDGNYDYCETYVAVEAHEACTGLAGSIAGVIMTEESEAVQGVAVSVNNAMTMTTAANGAFSFSNLAEGGDYTLTPYLNANPLNGVTTLDIIIISKHILGVDLLDSPYKMIAADANRSNTITTLDLIQLRKLVLNIDTEFAQNTSWRFVETAYEFPEMDNPWYEEFPELINENNLTASVTDANFVGVKIGDVNGSASANLASVTDNTFNGLFNFKVENTSLKAGNVYTVAFTGADMATVEGYQATLALKGAELVDVDYGVATAENFGFRYADQGMITTSWNGEATAEDVLFSLVIRATQDAELSDVLSISSKYTAAEAYRADNMENVAINFSNGVVAAAGFELYQNTPNPFQAETLIGFNLPVDAKATITVSDAAGRVLRVITTDATAGYNNLTLSKKDINDATGVLTYTVTAGEFTATKTMVAVK